MDSEHPLNKRRAGILLHITSLPKKWSNGDLGDEAKYFVDFLHDSKVTVWQTLPIHPLADPNDLSPYQPQSVHAGNPLLISIRLLVRKGWEQLVDPPAQELSIQEARTFRYKHLKKAHQGFYTKQNQEEHRRYQQFITDQAYWLKDYALFCALKEKYNGQPWWQWPSEYRDREVSALEKIEEELAEKIDFYYFEQFVFFEQWRELKNYANSKGVYLFGDMPFFAALDSVDVWANRKYFLLNAQGQPDFVAGDPPNSRFPRGQCWNNPLYKWSAIQAERFEWWKARFKTAHQLFDLIRLTHFRGFIECYAVPCDSQLPTDERCYWQDSPGQQLFEALKAEFGKEQMSRWMAEDIEVQRDPSRVFKLREEFELMERKIMQLAFYNLPGSEQVYLSNQPHYYLPNHVVYSGTHDSRTLCQWFADLDEERQKSVCHYLSIPNPENFQWYFIEAVFRSCAKLAIIPMQDILGLDGTARMNKPDEEPGIKNDANWKWRYTPGQLTAAKEQQYGGVKVEQKLSELVEKYGRN